MILAAGTGSVDNYEQEAPAGQTEGTGIVWPVRSGLVPPLADGFVARSESVPGLEPALVPGAAVALVPARQSTVPGAESGKPDWPGSSGKTQLAVQFAESLWRTRQIDLLVWVVATDRASILSGFAAAAADATGRAPSGNADLLAVRFISWLHETDRPWLVVIDGLTDARDIDGLLPTGPGGRTMITAAHLSALPASSQLTVLPVPGLSRREGLSYLMGRLTADPGQRLGAIDLVDQLEGEPIAMAQATALIMGTEWTCREYLDLFIARRDKVRPLGGRGPAPGETTWALAVERADQLRPGGAVRTLLVLMALFDGHWIPAPVFTSMPVREHLRRACGLVTPEEIWAAVAVLERTGLVTVDATISPAIVRMSRAVQTAIQAAAPAEAFEQVAQIAASGALEIWADMGPYTWSAASLRAATSAIMRQAGDPLWGNGCHGLLFRAGLSLERARLDEAAVAYWSELVAISHRVLGPGHPDSLQIDDRLADAFLTAGRAGEAIPWFRKLAADRAAQLGPGHPGTIESGINLGRALQAAGRATEAVGVLNQAVADCEGLRGADHAQTLRVRGMLADAVRIAGQPEQAIRLYRRTLTDRERTLGPTHPDTMASRQKLADTYLAQEKVKDALAQYKRLLADRERAYGPDHPETIAARGGLAAANHAAGRMASALRLYEQAGSDSERVLGVDHTDTLARNVNLAHAYYAVGRLTDAATLLRDTIARCERVLPPGDPLTLAVRESLANIAGGPG